MDVVKEQVNEKEPRLPLDIGALLVEARENRNFSTQDIAKQMNLSLSVIAKIESNQFAQDIPLAFIRGYVRSYAQRVGVDVETVCVEFDRQTGGSNAPLQTIKVVSSFKTRRKEMNSSNWMFKLITVVVFLLVIAFGGWEIWKRYTDSNAENNLQLNSIELSTSKPVDAPIQGQLIEAEKTNTALSVGENDAAESVATAVDLASNNEQSNADSSSANVELLASDDVQYTNQKKNEIQSQSVDSKPKVVATHEKKVLKTEPVVSMVFTFSEQCWVQISDANGEKIAYGTKQKGRVMSIEGVAPISVILGEPSVVALEYQGSAYDLSGYSAGKSASFTIE